MATPPLIHYGPPSATAGVATASAYTISPTVPEKHTYASGGEWFIIIIIILLIIAVLVWMVWFFGIRAKGLPSGSACSGNTQCELGTFCSANDTCEKGEGKSAGQKCDGNRDCQVGLFCNCNSGTCQSGSN